MLGCFKPDFSSLSQEEKDNYKALHCSMCRSIKKNYGTFETLFLNYDLNFIYLTNFPDLNLKKSKECCSINPFKKVFTYDLDFSLYSDLTIIFIYVALLDKKFDKEFSLLYRFIEKSLKRSIRKARIKFNRKLEDEVFESLKGENDLNEISSLYADILITHLSLKEEMKSFFKEMIKIMYYFDSFKDYFNDKKHNKFNVFSSINIDDVPDESRRLIVESIFKLRSYISQNSINLKTLEYSLQSKFNKLNIKFAKDKRRFS